MEHNYMHSESSGDDEETDTLTNDLTKHKNVFGETSSEEGSVTFKRSSSSEDHEEVADKKINHESTEEKQNQSLTSDVESTNENESSENSSGEELQPTKQVKEKFQKDNLFGDADDISSDDEEDMNKDKEETVQIKEVLRTESDDDDDDANFMQNDQKQQMDTRIEVEIPKISTDLGSAVHFVRFPNFISVEARPFDAAVYEDEIEEDELLDEEGRTRLKLKVENTIRWRKYVDENAIELIESNARIVKWSDGSMSMHLGSEIFDVHQMSIQGDHNHLFIRQGTGLQGQAVFKTKLTFRPNSTKSATHKKMTNRLAMRHNQNQQKVRVLPIAGQDPESRKADLMKVEEGLLKAHVRREALKRRIREKSHLRGLSSNYVEDDDNNGDSISAIKNEFKSGARNSRDDTPYNIGYESDEDRQKLLNSKRFGSDDEYDDDILGTKRKRDEDGEVRRKTYVLSDEEDDDDFANDNSQTSDNEQQSSQSS